MFALSCVGILMLVVIKLVVIAFDGMFEREKLKTELFILKETLRKHKDKSKYWESRYNSLKLQNSVWILEKEEEIERLGELLNGTNNK